MQKQHLASWKRRKQADYSFLYRLFRKSTFITDRKEPGLLQIPCLAGCFLLKTQKHINSEVKTKLYSSVLKMKPEQEEPFHRFHMKLFLIQRLLKHTMIHKYMKKLKKRNLKQIKKKFRDSTLFLFLPVSADRAV